MHACEGEAVCKLSITKVRVWDGTATLLTMSAISDDCEVWMA